MENGRRNPRGALVGRHETSFKSRVWPSSDGRLVISRLGDYGGARESVKPHNVKGSLSN